MWADVIVNRSLVQMEPIKCLELLACSHQMSECLFGFTQIGDEEYKWTRENMYTNLYT